MVRLPLIATVILACIHMPQGYEGSVEQLSQAAIIFWHEGREELIIKMELSVDPGAEDALPAALAWVVPVPAVPDGYGVENPELFRVVHDSWERAEIAASDWGPDNTGVTSESAPGIELLKPVSVGDYEIQPIRALGPASGQALNAWLAGNGFAVIPDATLRYYLDRDWTWLAVKAETTREGGIEARGALRPLRISFASESIVYPLKLSTHQGVFDLTLWVITAAVPGGLVFDESERHTLPEEPYPISSAYGFSSSGHWLPLPNELVAVQRRLARIGPYLTIPDRWVHLTKLVAQNVNGSHVRPGEWDRDFALVPGASIVGRDRLRAAARQATKERVVCCVVPLVVGMLLIIWLLRRCEKATSRRKRRNRAGGPPPPSP